MIKNLMLLTLIFSLAGCKEHNQKEPSALRLTASTPGLNKNRNIAICAINPNDCINCLYAFSLINDELDACQNDKVIVMNVDREIEKNELIRNTKNFDLRSRPGKYILWSKSLFLQLQKESKTPGRLSHISIYDPVADSLLFTKDIKSIRSAEILRPYLDYD